jgi:hypothetical protein
MMRSSIICNLSSNIRMMKSRKMRWMDGAFSMVKMRNAYRILVGNIEGKKPLKKTLQSMSEMYCGQNFPNPISHP